MTQPPGDENTAGEATLATPRTIGHGRTVRGRLLVASLFGIFWMVFVLQVNAGGGLVTIDWDQLWVAARGLLAGSDPYAAVEASRWPWPLYYPIPAVIVALPFSHLSLTLARALWFGICSGLLAYAWAREPWRLMGLFSGFYLFTATYAQLTPLLLAGLWLPWLSVLWVAKPNSGLALWVSRPSRISVYGGLALMVLGFALVPDWPLSWISALRSGSPQVAAVLRPGGFVLLTAVLRWRTPEGRLLLALACIPHTGTPYDVLLLYGVMSGPRQWFILTVLSWPVYIHVFRVLSSQPVTAATFDALTAQMWPAIFFGAYLPALVSVLFFPPTRTAGNDKWGATSSSRG